MLRCPGATQYCCALVFLLSCLSLLGQNSPPPATSASSELLTVPRRSAEYLMYEALFWHMVMQEKFADRIEADGHDARFTRAMTRKAVGLTIAEDNLLKSVAKDWLAKDRACRDQMLQLSKAASRSDRMALWQKIQDQEQAIMAEHIAQLQSGLGPDRFALLDAWVKTSIAPKIRTQRSEAVR